MIRWRTALALCLVARGASAQVSFAPPGNARFVTHPAWPTALLGPSADTLGFADARTVYTQTGSNTTCDDGVTPPVLVLDTARSGVPETMGAPLVPWMRGVDGMGRLLALAVSPDGWMYLLRGDCTHPAALVATLPPWRNPIAGEPLRYWGRDAGFAVAQDGEFCVSRAQSGVVCVREGAGSLTVTRFISRDVIGRTANIDPAVLLATAPRGMAGPWVGVDWEARTIGFTPGGSLFMLLQAEGARPVGAAPTSTLSLAWVVEAPRDGAPYLHAGPSGAAIGRAFVYEPALDAMLLTGATSTDVHTWIPGPQRLRSGWDGQGVTVFPVGRRAGVGRLDLSAQLYDTAGEFRQDVVTLDAMRELRVYRNVFAFSSARGTVWALPAWRRPTTGCPLGNCLQEAGYRAWQFAIDRDRVDLDGDGLDAAAERARNTSDFLLDTDGGGSQDNMEVLLGLDPTRPGDDRRAHGTQRLTYSPLIRSRLDPVARPGTATRWRHPWCRGTGPNARSGLECIASNGALVASFTFLSEGSVGSWRMSPDGEFLVTSSPQHAVDGMMLRLIDGQSAPYPPAQTATSEHGDVWPVDARSALLVDTLDGSGGLRVRALRVGETPRTVLDVAELDRMTRGTDFRAATAQFATVLGWHAGLRRLLTYVPTGTGSYLLGVSTSDAPVLLQRSAALAGFTSELEFELGPLLDSTNAFRPPSRVLDIGRGEYAWITGTSNPLVQIIELRDETLGDDPVDLRYSPSSVTAHQSAWGDTLIGLQTCSSEPCRDKGALEFVRVPDRPRPGDVLAFIPARTRDGLDFQDWSLVRTGPRGGVDTLLHGHTELAVSSMDVSPSGRYLCMLDETAGRLYELLFGVDGEGFTLTASFDLAATGYGDCRYDRADTLHLLGNTPPHRTTLDRAARALRPGSPTSAAGFLLRDREGNVVVFPKGTQFLGAGEGLDGQPIAVRTGLSLWAGSDSNGHAILGRVASTGGAPRMVFRTLAEMIRDDLRGVYASRGDNFFMAYSTALNEARWHLVQRPDGLILALPSFVPERTGQPIREADDHMIAIDPYTGRINEMTAEIFGLSGRPHALAIVPGGPAVDPWTGEAVAPGAIPEVPAGTQATGPDTFMQREPHSTTVSGRGEDPALVSGCATHPGRSTSDVRWLVTFVALAWRARRRRVVARPAVPHA